MLTEKKPQTIRCHHTPGKFVTCFLGDPSVRYKLYKTTAGMYISKSAIRTER